MKKNNKKGFTLAELLIVVAIIAVLTAIAIPVFTGQLESSRQATEKANARSVYAEVVAGYLLDDSVSTLTKTIDGVTYEANAATGKVTLTNKKSKNGPTSYTFSGSDASSSTPSTHS